MISRHKKYQRSLPPRRRLPRAAIFVVVFSVCGVALASLSPGEEPVVEAPTVRAADDGVRTVIDERLHLHLKRSLAVAGR
jgi:hypothetical protein